MSDKNLDGAPSAAGESKFTPPPPRSLTQNWRLNNSSTAVNHEKVTETIETNLEVMENRLSGHIERIISSQA